MIRNFITLLLLCVPFGLMAQTGVIYSEGFPEPENSYIKLMSLKNGNTLFLSITDDYIDVKVYDKAHKRVGANKIEHAKWTDRKISATSYSAILEANNQVVLFMSQQMKKNTPVLHAVLIDGATGTFSGAKEIMNIGPDREWSPYTVIKNDENENYVIAYPESREANSYRFIAFDKNHARIGETLLAPEGLFKINMQNISFRGNVISTFFNDMPLKSKELKQTLYLGTWNITDNAFVVSNMNAQVYREPKECSYMYNPVNGLYQAILVGKVDFKSKSGLAGNTNTVYYGMELVCINTAERKVVGQFEIGGADLHELAAKQMQIKNGYNGVFNKQVINGDGSTDILFEESIHASGSGSSSTTFDGNLGVLKVDSKWQMKDKFIIRKNQVTRSGGGVANWYKNEQYFRYSYFSKPGNVSYVVINDLPQNFKKSLTDLPIEIKSATEANAVLYKLSGNNVERTYLFGVPKEKSSSKFAMTGIAIYNDAESEYVTVMVDNKKGKKSAHIVWVKI